MALVLADRVRVSSSTTGTGAMSLSSSPVAGYQSFAAVGDGNTTYYTIAAGDQWEVGEGTYTASTNSLSRDSVFSSSNAGAKVDFAYGTKDVFVTLPATIASTAAADADAAAQSAQDAADDAAAADADRILAEAAAASSSANAARFSPYITVPAAASSLNRLVYVELYKYVGSTAISIPTRITVRDFARDSLNRFRLNLSSFDGVSTYTLVLAESAPPALFISAAGFTGLKNLDLYTTDTSFGIPSGTKIGVARVDFGDGSAFGSYNANNIAWSVGGLYTEAMVTNAAQDATTNGLILTNTQLSYLTSSQSLFVTTPSATSSVTVQGLLACVGISIYPSYPLGDSLVLVRECGRRSSDSFFRMQLATYDGVSAYTLLAATNNNNPIGASGYTGIYTFDLKAQSGNALGIAAGTVIGQVQINFGTGAAFGTYATSIPYSAGAVYNTRIQESTAVTEQLIDTALLNYTPSPFLTSVDNDYMRSIVDDIRIDFGVAGREYVLNVRSDTAGSTRRLTFFLYDPIREANIAIWARQASYDFASELPPSIYLSGAALGTKRNDVEYVGTGCTIFINKDNIQFNKGVTTYTTPAQGGINSDRVWSVEQTKQAIMSGVGVKNTMVTFGPDGDFASLELAVNSLFSTGVLSAAGDNPNNIQRAWWPFSDTCTPASQWTLQALPGCV